MNKKTMLIGLGVLAVAGIGYYMWKKKSETTSGADGEECGCGCEEKSNAKGYANTYAMTTRLVGCTKQECDAAGLKQGGNGCCYKTSKVMTDSKGVSIN